MKVDQASSPQTSKSVTPKISMFGAKSGFVIPKNKLSGSLVPVFRGANKSAKSGSVTDQNKQLASRKTKWGPDLTQDAFVRKGRLLAYQTRVDQIAKLIGTKDPETEAGQDVDMESRDANQESSHYEIDAEELEKLKLERREIIGEILKLNPSYKAPSDYVPLLKEAQVPLPIKDYPGYNFLGLIYGSGSDTLKRLEKETGAKIQVFGKKRDCPEKVEITSDAKKNQDDYEDLYALISADTYDKVDAAVSLVELLVTPVSASGSTLSVSNAPIIGQSSEPPSGLPNTAGEGVVQQLVRPQQIFHGQFQYNSPATAPSNPAQLLGSQMTPGGMVPTVSTSPLMSDPSPFPSALQSQGQFPMQPYISDSHTFGQTGPPRYPPVVAPPIFPSQPNIANVHQFSGSQPTPIGMSSMVRPLVTSLPQPAPGHPIRSQLNQDGSSAGWPRPPVPTPNSTMVGTSASAQGQQNTAFGMAQTVPIHPRPPAFLLPSNVNQGAATNTYVAPSPQVRSYSASSQGPSVATLPTHPLPNLAVQSPLIRGPVSASQNPAYRPGPVPLPRASAPLPPLNQSSFLPVRPVTGMPSGMQFPHSGDFVFQSQLPNSAAQIHPWPGSATQNNPPLRSTMQKPFDIRAPSLPPDFLPNQPQRPFPHGTFRTHADDHYDRFRPQFDEWNPSDVYSQPRFPPFPKENFGMRNAPLPRMGGMSMDRSHQMINMHGSFPLRPGNDYPPPAARPGRNPLNINPSGPPTYRHSRIQQAYDPFSPTTGSAAHQQQQQVNADAKSKNQETNDPEYEDLMASVGVK